MRSRALLTLLTFWCPLLFAQVQFKLVKPQVIKTRLNLYPGNDLTRVAALVKSFSEVGCSEDKLSEQAVPRRKEPNVVCVLPGETDQVILVGAHFDHVSKGKGVVDNWSGASLLPSLFQSLSGTSRRHTFIFAGFTGEEDGLIGSRFYVKQLSAPELSRVQLMVTLDTLGLGPTKVWVSRSDPEAVSLLMSTANVTRLPLEGMNVDGFGISDEESFIKKKIKTVTVHSLTSDTTQVLHSSLDDITAIKFENYYDTYHLLAAYLALIDTKFPATPAVDNTSDH